MAFEAITTTEIEVGKPVSNSLFTKIKNSLDYLNGQTGASGGSSSGIPNASMELDSDSDGTPDEWTFATYPGGSVSLNTTTPAHGSQGVQMVHPGGAGNGGGYAESEYVECSEVAPEILGVIHWATAAGMKNEVVVRFFDKDKVDLVADSTLYSSTANPTSKAQLLLGFTPPATACYYKVRLIGGYTDTDVAGTAYFDGLTRQTSHRTAAKPYDPINEGTLTEQSRSGSTADVGSFVVDIPHRGVPVILTFSAEVRNGDGVNTATQRFRVGTVYSNSFTTTDSSYDTKTYTLELPATEVAAEGLTVYHQLGSASDTAYGRKTTTDARAKYNADGEV